MRQTLLALELPFSVLVQKVSMDLKQDCQRELSFRKFGLFWPLSPGRRFIHRGFWYLHIPHTCRCPSYSANVGGVWQCEQNNAYHSASSRPINNAKGMLYLIIALSLATNPGPLLSLYDSRGTAVNDLFRGSYRLAAKDRHG